MEIGNFLPVAFTNGKNSVSNVAAAACRNCGVSATHIDGGTDFHTTPGLSNENNSSSCFGSTVASFVHFFHEKSGLVAAGVTFEAYRK